MADRIEHPDEERDVSELKRIAFLIDQLGFRAHDAEVAIGEDADAIVAAEDGHAIFLRSIALDLTTLRQQLTEAQADRDRLETLYCLIMEHPQPTDVLAQATARMSEELIVAARRFVDAHVAPWIADRNAAIAARLASSSESGR